MTEPPRPLTLFISYSHKDDEWRAKLDTHLALLKRQRVFDVWHDRRIDAGREWAGEIDDALEWASVVLLLVSSDFLASDYCYDREMKRALQRHEEQTARVVPVVLRKCDWHSSDFGKLQAVPRDGKPIASYSDVDEAMTEVALALRKVSEEMRDGSAEISGTPPCPSTLGVAASVQTVEPGSSGTLPGLATAGESPIRRATLTIAPSDAAMTPAPARKRKNGAIKLWFPKSGPFESGRPHLRRPHLRRPHLRNVAVALAATMAALVLATTASYSLLVKPPLDDARNKMRRGAYISAAQALEVLPQWATTLHGVKALKSQAAFGSRLSGGEHIDELAPELHALATLYPEESNVLVFLGSKAYYEQNLEQAILHFTRASDRDPAHVQAHFLGAGRNVELAYAAMGRGDEPVARAAAAEARRLINRALERSSFARSVWEYANQIAELDELEGNSQAAYEGYEKLAPQHSASAVQAAMLSWRLAQPDPAVRNGLESVEAATSRIEQEASDAGAVEGWTFRVSSEQVVHVRPKNEKLCLLEWVQELSRSLLSTVERGSAADNDVTNRVPKSCGSSAIAERIVQIVCVEVITALDRLPSGDRRWNVLDSWKAKRLSCAAGLRPIQVLPASGGSAGPTGRRAAPSTGIPRGGGHSHMNLANMCARLEEVSMSGRSSAS